jgi:hypothetical protein
MERGRTAFSATRVFLALALGCAALHTVRAQQPERGSGGQSALVHSDTASFWIDVPRGWVFDAEAGRRDGAIAVLYRQGESWDAGDPVMYASVITPHTGFNPEIPAALRSDSARWAGQASDFALTIRDSIRTVSGAFAYMRSYGSVSSRQYDTVAYLQADGRVWMLTLSAGSPASQNAGYADFVALVKSYVPGPKGEG